MKVRILAAGLIGRANLATGDVVDLPEDRAKVLIERGHAEAYTAPERPAPKPETADRKSSSKAEKAAKR